MRKSKLLILLGSLLVFCSLALMLFSQVKADVAQKDIADLLSRLEEILPSGSVGTPDSFSSNEMPVLEIDKKNVVAILHFTESDLSLPVMGTWNKNALTSYPHRFSGSVYDGSLIVGGSDQKGQFDCLKKLDIGYTVTVTDMTGAEYFYTVDRIERKKSAGADVLTNSESALTLFVREAYSAEYIIVRCTPKI